MAARTISDDVLLGRLSEVFRGAGFNAASLERISEATGLQKSSLYHRFPGGKEQMAEEVTSFVGRLFAADVLGSVHRRDIPVAKRIDAIARNLRRFYQAGRQACVLDVLSIEHITDDTTTRLAAAAAEWIDAFASLSREAGLARDVAAQRAEDAVARIEGALVIARATGSTKAFDRALRRLAADLTTP